MKTLTLFFLLSFSALAGNTNQLRLAWDYPTNSVTEDLVFLLKQHTNAAAPLTNWVTAYTVSGTNNFVVAGETNVYTVTLTNQPGRMFFFCTASNLWGESDPSNVVNAPPQAQKPGLKIGL